MAQLPRQIGPYRVEGRLGAGNMGVVFRVRHAELDACYALKVLRTDLGTPHDLARFQREIELVAAASQHPNIVGIHTAAHEQGRIYYVMDLVEGQDLQARVQRGPLPARQAARYARDLAGALAFLHAQGIVHRDVKPANVLIDDQDRPRLSDFGLARAFTDDQQRLTRTGELIGTPYYMAPEQARGQQVGPPADVYALGMLLHTLLAGRPAVSGATALEVVEQIRHGRLRPLSEAAPEAPAALAVVCSRALAPDPAARPTAAELQHELDLFLDQADGGPSVTQAGRRRLALGVGAVLLGLGLAAAGILLRGEPRAAPVTALPEAVDRELQAAVAALARGAVDEATQYAQAGLALCDVELLPPELSRSRVRLLRALGVAACRRGDPLAASSALQEAEAWIGEQGGAELRELRRHELAALRAGLELLQPAAGDGYDLEDALRDLARAREHEPEEDYLIGWRVRAAVAVGRPEVAVADLAAASEPQRLPVEARCAVWLAAGELEQAAALLEGLEDPALAAQIHYALGLPALRAEQWAPARQHLAAAAAASPDDPRREQALRLARSQLERAGGWTRGGDPSIVNNALRREVDVALVVRALDPGFTMPRARVDAIYGALGEIGHRDGRATVELVHDLLQVEPNDVALYKVFAALVVDWGLPQPTRDMALIRQGLALATDPSDRRLLIEQLAVALYTQLLLPELTELAEAVLDEDHAPELKAFVSGRVGDLLRHVGRLDESAEWLARTRELNPDGQDLVAFTYAFHRTRHEQGGAAADLEAARAKAWEFLAAYRPGSWDDWLLETCTWVCLQEETLGRLDRAVAALEVLRRFASEALRWEARRLGLLARLEPYDAERMRRELAGFPAQIEATAHRLGSASDERAEPAERERLRARAVALLQLPTRHLVEYADLDQRAELVRGLAELEASLARIDAE